MTVTQNGSVNITTIYQLLGSQTTATVNGKSTTLKSPWPSSSDQLMQTLPDLLDKLSISGDEFIQGRINVSQVSYGVLMGIPNMTETMAQQIIGAQSTTGSSSAGSSTLGQRTTNAWLVTEGIIDVVTMQQFDRYFTARGDVYRVESVGFFDDGGPVVRLEAIIDGSIQPPRILNVRELSELGRGYSHQQLGVP
jgi:hypothetical protein